MSGININPPNLKRSHDAAEFGRHMGISESIRSTVVKKMQANAQFAADLSDALGILHVKSEITWGKRPKGEDDEAMSDASEIDSDAEMTEAQSDAFTRSFFS